MSAITADFERVRTALSFLDYNSEDVWIRAAMAIKSEFGNDGFDMWDDWGSQYDRYRAKDAKARWKSIKESGGVTIASLFYDAKQAGWRDDKKHEKPSREVIDQRKANAARRQAQAEAEEAEARAAAASHARFMWEQADPCEGDDHPYLKRKGVRSHGLRVGSWEKIDHETGEIDVVSRQALLIPIWSPGKIIHSLQAIFTGKVGDRDKDFVRDGAISGNYYSFGKPSDVEVSGQLRKVILIGEGYATLASAHDATGHACIVAFHAGNVPKVARVMREQFPDAALVFLADNDRGTKNNPGVTKAREAADAVGGFVAVPQFEEGEDDATDFNDLHQLRGLDAVREVIEAALRQRCPSIKPGEGIRPVWMVPSTSEADLERATFAAEVAAMHASQHIDPRGVLLRVYSGVDHLKALAAEVKMLMPNAKMHAIIGGSMVPEVSKIDCSIEVLYADESWVDNLLAAMNMKTELAPAAHATSEQALVQARDEDRRRLQQEENRRLQEDVGAMIPSNLTVDEMLERCVWIADGRSVAYVTDDRSMFLKVADFSALTVASKTEVEVQQGEKIKKKWMGNANLWQSDLRRVDAMTATFRPGAPIITANPKGARAVNTWRPIKRWNATGDIGPFLEQVEYLFPDPAERGAFLDWLAHIEQRPGELPHYGWLHIAENTGTGRNWMSSVLARVFRGYTAPNVDLPALLDSPYNGELGGCVLAIVDEVQEGASEGSYRHTERLKSMVNAETRTVNNKYGLKYLEFNALRWLVFSNHKNALPLNDEDRRFRVVMHRAPPRSPAVYERLYALLQDPEFINAIGVYLSERDISRFKPGERPPLNSDKLAAIAASKPMSTQAAEEIVAAWPADVITSSHVIELLGSNSERSSFTPAMRRAMEEAGAQQWHRGSVQKVKVDKETVRVWILRSHDKWVDANQDAIRGELRRAPVSQSKPAALVLAEAGEGLKDPAF